MKWIKGYTKYIFFWCLKNKVEFCAWVNRFLKINHPAIFLQWMTIRIMMEADYLPESPSLVDYLLIWYVLLWLLFCDFNFWSILLYDNCIQFFFVHSGSFTPSPCFFLFHSWKIIFLNQINYKLKVNNKSNWVYLLIVIIKGKHVVVRVKKLYPIKFNYAILIH